MKVKFLNHMKRAKGLWVKKQLKAGIVILLTRPFIESIYICFKYPVMKTVLFNVAWLIIVTINPSPLFSQISIHSSNPVELTILCDQLNEMNPPIANTTCNGDLSFTHKDRLLSGGCYNTIERNWTIKDDCGNAKSFIQYIKRKDEIGPTLSETPSNISVTESNIPENFIITAKDNCSENCQVMFSEEIIKDDSGKTKKIIRRWTTKDACNNSTSHEQIITIIQGNS